MQSRLQNEFRKTPSVPLPHAEAKFETGPPKLETLSMFPPPERRRTAASLARRLRALLLVLPALRCAAVPHAASPRILTGALGGKKFQFNTTEKHITLYHAKGSSSVFVGAENKLYIYNLEDSTSHVERFDISTSLCENPEDATNYLTFIEKYQDKVLICGTNACRPTCWNWVDGKKELGIGAQSLAPFGLDKNSLVLIDGNDIYSTIRKYQSNGRIPRFRRVRGAAELYTSDTVMKNPQFVKIAPIKQEEAYNDKIYFFFREDNPNWPNNPLAPRKISRVAQVCKGDKGGNGSFSAAKWTTLLKATLLCVDSATKRNFEWLQDVFIVESDQWFQTKIYGLFLNEWGYSAVCVYSVSDISEHFRTSPLKNYSGKSPAVKPGQCLEGNEKTPPETFKVIDSYPELAAQMNGKIVFYSKHHYQQLGVHQVEAANNEIYNVLYLATDKGSIHKVVVLPKGPMNILEIQPFQSQAGILAMILDHSRNELIVASANEVVQLPMASCGAYQNNCGSCVLSRDPYCGWINEECTSIYEQENGTLLQSLSHDVPRNICPTSNNLTSEDCLYFIDNMTDQLYGKYSCVSREDWFYQTVLTEYLENPSKDPENKVARSVGLASAPSLSFWLGILHMIGIVLIIQ
ncbi:semaphorin-7A [Protobothrops mucrosquamatus]|uniref:semaphorin-7A n=2 Tax=Protobothrops mucrosquamatus TaxID=103944 RepID=UPI000775F8C8|nr:semaphorin-7A [Protobothrops mucrosquamatus]